MSTGTCFDSKAPVLGIFTLAAFLISPLQLPQYFFEGGVDFVQYFTTFKVDSGVYNESMVGKAGDSTINATYNGHLFHFLSVENKNSFMEVKMKLIVS